MAGVLLAPVDGFWRSGCCRGSANEKIPVMNVVQTIAIRNYERVKGL